MGEVQTFDKSLNS